MFRQIILTWIGVYPALTAIALLLEPWLSNLPLALQTLIMSAIMVPVMLLWVMPLIERVLRPGAPTHPSQR